MKEEDYQSFKREKQKRVHNTINKKDLEDIELGVICVALEMNTEISKHMVQVK